MFEDLLKTVRSIYSGESAKNWVADISRFHRIQASPGLRAAANYCHQKVQSFGLDAELLTFPARLDASSWSYGHLQEWECTHATLDLLEPAEEARRLADFSVNPLSIIQRTGPFEGDVEIVAMEDGSKPEDYENVDVKGKIVFFSKPLEAVRDLAVEKNGAVGLITDFMSQSETRPYLDLPEALQYISFWWKGPEKRVFGFVLSPGAGLKLRALIKKENEEGRTVKARVDVKSRLFDGEFEAVTALLPGETNEEVVMVGHICHPAPGGNDNSSGAAATMEAARALQAIVAEGRLPKPRRSIRFLWVPEILGSYAYLASHESEIDKMIAGVNMDMVGENQELCRSSFLIDLPPESMASFAGDLMEGIRDEIAKDTSSFAGTGNYALFRYATTPYGGGSDHIVFNDPSVGVPMPMLIQWPDRFYHTSADSLDKVDPKMLGIIGSVASTYAYWIANAGEEEARDLGELMLAKAKQRVVRTALELPDDDQRLSDVLAYRVGREHAAFDSLLRLAPELDVGAWKSEIEDFTKRELTRLRPDGKKSSEKPEQPDKELIKKAAAMIPVRKIRGPINVGSHQQKLSEQDRQELKNLSAGSNFGGVPRRAANWADGKRTIQEIAHLVKMESGTGDLKFISKYFELLEKMDLVELRSLRATPC